MYYIKQYESDLGKIFLAAGEAGLAGLWIEGQKFFEDMGEAKTTEEVRKSGFAELNGDGSLNGREGLKALEILEKTEDWLNRYFKRQHVEIGEIPLCPAGSRFRQLVWKILCEIPLGETVTYGDVAREIMKRTGKKAMSAQAVGGAVGHNPISIIIPCHRVVGSNGSLTGYGGGIDKKIALLQLEGVDTDRFFVPKKGTAL